MDAALPKEAFKLKSSAGPQGLDPVQVMAEALVFCLTEEGAEGQVRRDLENGVKVCRNGSGVELVLLIAQIQLQAKAFPQAISARPAI